MSQNQNGISSRFSSQNSSQNFTIELPSRGANQALPARLVMTGADEDGGITVAVVVSERLFKDAAAADPSLIPNPKIGPRYLAMLDYFLGLPGNISWSHPW